MGLLSQDTIHELVEAACAAELRCDALLSELPSAVRSALPTGAERSHRDHLIMIFGKLNQWIPHGGEEALILALLRTARLLSSPRPEARTFDRALAELAHQAKAPRGHDKGAFYVRRVKQFYLSHGYNVAPHGGEYAPTFFAWRGDSMVSFIAVAVDDVKEAVEATLAVLRRERVNEPWMEGCIVLLDQDESQSQAHVRSSGLRSMLYRDLHPIGFPEFESLVLRQHAEILAGPKPAPGSADHPALEGLMELFLKSRRDRVLLLEARDDTSPVFERTIRLCTTHFDTKVGAPVPIALPLASASLSDLVGGAFRRHEIRYSPIGLPKWLEEGALLLIFTAGRAEDCRGDALNVVQEALLGTSKVVLITPREEGLAALVERRLHMPVVTREHAQL